MSATLKAALIVDDEPLGRDLVRHMLAAHPDFRVAGECADGEKALAAIKRLVPQVVFLDVKMPRMDGVKLLQKLPDQNRPLIIFVTAHEAYALEAFDGQALDYLLKPFDQERFDETMDRVRIRLEQLEAAKVGHSVQQYLAGETGPGKAVPRPAKFLERIVVRDRGRVYFVEAADISWFEACGNYVALHTAAGQTQLVHETMTAMEAKLDPAVFVRIHRSTIVNAGSIKMLEPHFNSEFIVVLADGSKLKLSRTYLESARKALGLT